MSDTANKDILIQVKTQYLEKHTSVPQQQYVFAYHIHIVNQSVHVVQLLRRHWIITHAGGHIDVVDGEGVVGLQPVLRPGESFEYQSSCVLKTPCGSMEGYYEMAREDGTLFRAEIEPFVLATPYSLN